MTDRGCPSCGAPLDADGICPSCGALSRGFFRGLDLGAPQIANAVAHGLDFYRLLEIAPDADLRAVARRYRQLRVWFPDDPFGLEAAPARRLALLEVAGRTLTDPRLRRIYDELRAGRASEVGAGVVRCPACAAPFQPMATHCLFCGTPRPAHPAAPGAPPEPGPPATDPVDYYALLGLPSRHLSPPMSDAVPEPSVGLLEILMTGPRLPVRPDPPLHIGEPPSQEEIDAAALAGERQALLTPGISAEERAAREEEYELARRILREPQRRDQYDALLRGFRRGELGGGRLDALRQLQDAVRAEIAEERGERLGASEGAALLRQGQGYLDAGLPREAVAALRRAVQALPDSPQANAAYVRAILAADDPLDLGPHQLREVVRSLDALGSAGAPLDNGPALAALCRGLLARDAGESAQAEAELRQAAGLDANLAPAWRGLAALALGRGSTDEALNCCRRALALNPRDERALLMAAAACLRARRREQAREAAAQVAALRGSGWSAEDVLRELNG